MRSTLPICVLLGTIASSQAVNLLNRTSIFNPSLWWLCREPTASEAASMVALKNPKFAISTDYDPIGISGGCMPDATCVDGHSSWTNVFGYVVFDDFVFVNMLLISLYQVQGLHRSVLRP